MVRDPALIPAIAMKKTVESYRSMDGEACPQWADFLSASRRNGSTDGGAMA